MREDYEFWSTIDLEQYYNIVVNSINEFELNDYVNVIRSTSDDAPVILGIDLLYIDGQHTQQALKDAMKYATEVKEGGYCLLDDVNWGDVGIVPKFLTEVGFDLIHTLEHCYIYKKKKKHTFPINVKSPGSAWIVDNFYEDPEAVREFALGVDYFEGGVGRGFIGRRSKSPYLFDGLKERFEQIIGKKITGWVS